jgi:hypothetical protein
MTRGERNHNPGNIRRVKGVIWVGQSPEQTDDAFVQFTDAKYGIRAIARILASYERQGIDTLGQAIDRWAPPNENNSQAYVDAVCADCGIGPDTLISLRDHFTQIVTAIIRHENGGVIYSPDEILQGIALA